MTCPRLLPEFGDPKLSIPRMQSVLVVFQLLFRPWLLHSTYDVARAEFWQHHRWASLEFGKVS